MTQPTDRPPEGLPARYTVDALLGVGGMGEVWRVHDSERGEDVALKLYRLQADGDDTGRLLFKQEFWAMATLVHPHLVPAYDYGELDGRPYFTLALVDGQDLAARLPLDEATVRGLLPGLLSALSFLHARGFLHSDLKPENIQLTHDGRVLLMDLGLLTPLGQATGPIRGSLHYLAPEAIQQGALDARSDLYALGCVLYHLLASEVPFAAYDTLTLLRAHLSEPPPALAARVPGLSAELATAVHTLMAKAPGARYASAAELARALGMAAELTESQALLSSPLVGRDALFAEAVAALGAPARLGLVGEAGSGKSRLLRALAAEAQLAGVPTLTAAGLGLEAAPYQALAPWLRALTSVPGATRDRLAPLLVRLVPTLDVAPAPPLEGAQERIRLHAAVVELAQAIFDGPRAWLLDDADQLDAPSIELVTALMRAGATRPWTWLLASAGDGAPATERILSLTPFDAPTTLSLAGHLLGLSTLPEAVAERLPLVTGGLPGAVEAVLRHWIRVGALQREAGQWVVGAAQGFELPGGLAVVRDARFEALKPEARSLAGAAALLGPTGERAVLEAVVGLPPDVFFAAWTELVAAEVLTGDGSQGFRFVRIAQQEGLAAAFQPDEAAQLHGRAAGWHHAALAGADLAQAPLGQLIALARHQLAGPDPAPGVPWALLAAQRSLGLYAVSQAEVLLKAVLTQPALSPATHSEALGLMGYVLRFKGDIDAALALYEQELLPVLRATPDARLAEHGVTYGALLQLKGRYDEAMAAFAQAINMADEVDSPLQGLRARLFAGRVAFFAGKPGLARTPLKGAIRRGRALLVGASPTLAPQVRSLLGRALGFYGYVRATEAHGEAEGLTLLDEAITLHRALGDLRETHESLNNQGNVLMAAGRYGEARTVFSECLVLCDQMGSANEAIFAHLNLGAVLLELGDLTGAQGHAERALGLARAQGRKFPEGYLLALLGTTEIAAGSPAVGYAHIEEGLALAREIKNKYLELNVQVYAAQALVSLGRFSEAEQVLAEAQSLALATENAEFAPKLERAALSLSVATRRPEAGEQLEAAVTAARQAKQPAQLAHLLRWQAAVRAQRAEWREAERTALEALSYAEPQGLARLVAELHGLIGQALQATQRSDAAASHFRQALSLAETGGDRLGAAVFQAALGTSTRDVTQNRAAHQALSAMLSGLAPEAQAAFMAWPERRAVSEPFTGQSTDAEGLSAERLRQLTSLIASVSQPGDLFGVMNQALVALVELARAERGFVVLYDGFLVKERLFYGLEPGESDAFSTGLAEQVLWTGEPVFIEDASADEALASRQSVMALSLRSVLGLPLKDGDNVIGVMIADSRSINHRWRPVDLDLAMALAQAVAIAVSHARRSAADHEELEELRLLHALALETAGLQDLDALAASLVPAALKLTGAERGYVLLGESGALSCQAAFDAGGEALDLASAEFSHSVCDWVLAEHQPLYLVDVQSDEAFQSARSVMALGLTTIYGAPLMYQGRCFGLLYLDSRRMGEPAPRALATLTRLGELAGAFLARR